MSNSWDRPVPSSLTGGKYSVGHFSVASSHTGTVSKQATKVKIVSCKLEWRIDQFKKLMKFCKNGENVVSEQFLSVSVPSLVWELHIYPSGKREEDKGSVSFFLRQVASQELPSPITADFQIYALDGRGTRVSICHDIKDFSDLQGRGKFQIPYDKVASVLHADGCLLVFCEVEFMPPGSKLVAKHTNEWERSKSAQLSFRDSNRVMWENQLFTDCQIQVGSTKFMAHKCILAQKSQVFCAMFSQKKMNEAQSGHIDISDFPAEAIGAMLEFIYTGEIGLAAMAYSAQEILAAADKYDVVGLKEHCELYLSSVVNARNICELVVLADHYSASKLKEECARFIAVHYSSVIRMPKWNELKLSCGALVNELLESALDGHCLSSLNGEMSKSVRERSISPKL